MWSGEEAEWEYSVMKFDGKFKCWKAMTGRVCFVN